MAGLKNVALYFFICFKVDRIEAPRDKEKTEFMVCCSTTGMKPGGDRQSLVTIPGTKCIAILFLCSGSDITVEEEICCKGCIGHSFEELLLKP